MRASLAMRSDRDALAVPLLRQAIGIGLALPDENDLSSVDALQLLGAPLLRQGDAAAAEVAYRRMLERNRDGAHAQEADVGQRSPKLAEAIAAQGRCAEAAVALGEARTRAAGFPATLPIHAQLEGGDWAAAIRQPASLDHPNATHAIRRARRRAQAATA